MSFFQFLATALHRRAAAGGAVYGLGLIGAAVYFLPHAGSFVAILTGLLKAIFWPAFLVYHLFVYLHI